MFYPKGREIRVPEYRRGVKDPNTTQWRRGPVSHTANVSKSFSVTRLNFGQGVGKEATDRQSALLPTCDALDSIIHANVYGRDQAPTGRYHNTTLDTN